MQDPLLEISSAHSTSKGQKNMSHSPKKHDKSLLVEIKNGKVVFRQKPLTFEKQSETLQELVKFRNMLEEKITQDTSPLNGIPDEHKPLIAKLAHESDKTLAALSKHILHELIPPQDDDGQDNGKSSAVAILPLLVVEASIKAILNRNNYGLDIPSGFRAPASLSVWRWEVKDGFRDWLPKSAREKADARQSERVQAKEELKAIFDALSPEEQDMIIGPKGSGKQASKETPDTNLDASGKKLIDLTAEGPKADATKKAGKRKEDDQTDATEAAKLGRPKKAQDPEKLAKEKERLGRKAAKAEKEKKEKDAQNKSRSLMANFFSKTKARGLSKEAESIYVAPKSQTDFEKTFRPFALKKDTTIAPVNRFLRVHGPASHVIYIDEEVINAGDNDIVMDDPKFEDLTNISAEERLRGILSSTATSSSRRRRNHKPSHLKTYWPISVRDIINQLSEAEIAGDDFAVRKLLFKLRDRRLIPTKLFIFAEDVRPGYFGTWTRSSKIIGPRTPFAKDVLTFDYGYDSGEEWEEEPAGDADDVVEDGEDEEVDEDVDSDLESWLVDDDEEPQAMAFQAKDPDLLPPHIDLEIHKPKRKAAELEPQASKKRKIVVPLVPFSKGPYWEATIGICEYEPFNTYRIQLFNDTPLSIDPFKFVSTCLEDKRASEHAVASSSTKESVFAVPSLPERLIATYSTPISTNTTPSSKSTLTPKNPFPDAHLPFLVKRIAELQAPSVILLVETLYQELKSYKVKKNAIEAKVREVGERCKEKKIWVVKPTVHV